MIKRLKFKLIITTLISLLALLLIIVLVMNILNLNTVKREADMILSILSQNHGDFPEADGTDKPAPLPPSMSPETPHENRFFTVALDKNYSITSVNTSKILSVDENSATEYAKKALDTFSERGFIGNFRYLVSEGDDEILIIFLDMGRRFDAYYGFLFASVMVALGAFLIISIVFSLIAGRIIKPIADSYEKQKRFITDAGHEIKTPLTIIGANVDVLKMDIGAHESLDDITKQIERLRNLTSDLIYLARMEEGDSKIERIEFPISEVVRDTATSFLPVINNEEKNLTLDIQPLLSLRADIKATEQLIIILMDNATKYSIAGTDISLSLKKHARSISLSVTNQTDQPLDKDSLSKIFDRFYRSDPSRSEIRGNGIGLSIAHAIASAHGGKITAELPTDNTFKITVTLPQ